MRFVKHEYVYGFIGLLIYMLPVSTPFSSKAYAQDTEEKIFNLNGKDFSYSVQKTPTGGDFGYFAPASRWPRAADGTTVVYVCWENPDPKFQQERHLVHDAVTSTWQAHSKIQFIGWQTCAAKSSGIRIFIVDDSNNGPHTKGLGRDLDGRPQGMVLNFTFNTWSQSCKTNDQTRAYCIKGIAVHEFGHAIGFAHEQNRPDRPGECREPAQGSSVGAVMLTPYDSHSVMNYCNEKYNNDGQLSELDVVALQKMYGSN